MHVQSVIQWSMFQCESVSPFLSQVIRRGESETCGADTTRVTCDRFDGWEPVCANKWTILVCHTNTGDQLYWCVTVEYVFMMFQCEPFWRDLWPVTRALWHTAELVSNSQSLVHAHLSDTCTEEEEATRRIDLTQDERATTTQVSQLTVSQSVSQSVRVRLRVNVTEVSQVSQSGLRSERASERWGGRPGQDTGESTSLRSVSQVSQSGFGRRMYS